MAQKGVVLALGLGVILLLLFSVTAQPDTNINPAEAEMKLKGHGRDAVGAHYSEDAMLLSGWGPGRRCCGYGPGGRYCVRWCRNAEEAASFEAYANELGRAGYSVDQIRCCQGGRFGGCARWC